MADLVRTHDLTDASQHGWAVDYLIQREDGAELHVEVRCWDRAREAADNASDERRWPRSPTAASPPRWNRRNEPTRRRHVAP